MSEHPAMPQMLNAEWVEKATPERFAGQTVVVTGAASGIGRAVAVRVVAEGGRVIAWTSRRTVSRASPRSSGRTSCP
ncbi:SDR family NAD(P)-dependent oxidoreductase [Kocuria rhizophila]